LDNSYIYFDHASTSHPKPPCLWLAIKNYLETIGASPGRSSHRLSKLAHNQIIQTKNLLARLFHLPKGDNIYFSSNATTGINLILKGFLKQYDHVITTNLEHNSVLRPLEKLKITRSVSYDIVFSDSEGRFQLSEFEKKITSQTKLFVINHGSNVIGVTTPIKEIAEICKKYRIKLLVDTAQTAGLIDINLTHMDEIDFLAFTGHKSLLGPSGIGGFYVKDPFCIDTLYEGGTGTNSHTLIHPETPPFKFEAGTLNYLGIAGLGATVNWLLEQNFLNFFEHEMNITEYCMQKLQEIEEVILYGPRTIESKLPLLSFNLKGFYAGEVSYFLDEQFQICTRPGLQCAPLVHKTLGTFPHGTVRLSFGHTNTFEEIDYFIQAIKKILSLKK